MKAYKTVNFWVNVVATLVGLVIASGAVSDPGVLQILGGLAAFGGAAGVAKKKELES